MSYEDDCVESIGATFQEQLCIEDDDQLVFFSGYLFVDEMNTETIQLN